MFMAVLINQNTLNSPPVLGGTSRVSFGEGYPQGEVVLIPSRFLTDLVNDQTNSQFQIREATGGCRIVGYDNLIKTNHFIGFHMAI